MRTPRLGMMVRVRTRLQQLASRHRGMGMRGGRVLVIAAILVAGLGWTREAKAAGLKSVSVDEFRAEVGRLEGVVTECATAVSTCDSGRVGDDAMVGDPAKGGFEEHWGWLRDTLDQAKTAKAEERVKLLRDAESQLEEMGKESWGTGSAGEAREFGQARVKANQVLSRVEFQRGGGPTWWDRLKARIFGWIAKFFMGVERVGVAAPWLGTLLEWMCFVGAGVGLLFFLLRNVARQRLRVALGDAGVQKSAWDREAEDWAMWAEQHAEAEEWREAVHCLYWAAIVSLESRRAWRHNPTRTPREYVRLLKPGSAQEQGLRRLTQIFERVWYGLREANAEEYAESLVQYERLSAAGAGADAKAMDALPAGGAA
jgi:hypothetical protein